MRIDLFESKWKDASFILWMDYLEADEQAGGMFKKGGKRVTVSVLRIDEQALHD